MEAEEFQNKIIEEEICWLCNEYNLSRKDVEEIFDEYYLDYRDRGVVGYVFDNTLELGYEEAWSLGYVDNKDTILNKYFDYEKFGEDLLEDENYFKLSDERVVSLNY